MRNLLIAFTVVLGLGLSSCERRIASTYVPSTVQSAFYSNFPNAQKVKWQRMGRRYDAKFKQNNKHFEAKFREDGTFVKLED